MSTFFYFFVKGCVRMIINGNKLTKTYEEKEKLYTLDSELDQTEVKDFICESSLIMEFGDHLLPEEIESAVLKEFRCIKLFIKEREEVKLRMRFLNDLCVAMNLAMSATMTGLPNHQLILVHYWPTSVNKDGVYKILDAVMNATITVTEEEVVEEVIEPEESLIINEEDYRANIVEDVEEGQFSLGVVEDD